MSFEFPLVKRKDTYIYWIYVYVIGPRIDVQKNVTGPIVYDDRLLGMQIDCGNCIYFRRNFSAQ